MKEYNLSEFEAIQYVEKNFTNKSMNEYKSDNMNKPFLEALSELKGTYDNISVFWTDNKMYVNDKSDNQAEATTTLFRAYKFALLIQTPNFDYDASDKDVKQFHEELLKYCDEDNFGSDEERKHCLINVWDYLDDIADDYYKLTRVKINDIDFKRAIVSYMSETDLDNECGMGFGSATYIARLLSDHIIGNERNNIKRCNNNVAIELAEQYLQTDTYNLYDFAKALHNTSRQVTVRINGVLWVNCAKYEYVDKIIISKDDVDIYYENKMIGSIERKNINTIEEQYVETGKIANLEDVLNFDIKKVGDF